LQIPNEKESQHSIDQADAKPGEEEIHHAKW